MEKVTFNFGNAKTMKEYDYAYRLLEFLNENDYYLLPNYPFKWSFDELYNADFEEIENGKELERKMQEYSYYCLTHLEEVIKENEE